MSSTPWRCNTRITRNTRNTRPALTCAVVLSGEGREQVKDAYSRATVSEVLHSAMHMDSAKAMRAHDALVRCVVYWLSPGAGGDRCSRAPIASMPSSPARARPVRMARCKVRD